jgi:hypothetical protein
MNLLVEIYTDYLAILGVEVGALLHVLEDYDGEVYLNGELIMGNDLSKSSCFISENQFDGINSSDDLLSAKECIEKALKISKLPYALMK